MADFSTPKRASLQDIKDILKAYYLEGAHNEAVTTSEVETTADMSDKVGRQTKFLVETGLIEKEGRSDRRLTQEGEEISEALMAGNESLAQSLMNDQLSDWEFTSKVTGFLRMQEPDPVDNERLTEYISANTNGSDRRGRKTLLEMLSWAGIIEETEEGYKLSSRSQDEESDSTDVANSTTKKADSVDNTETEPETELDSQEIDQASSAPVTEVKTPRDGINIQIEIRGDDDPDNVESVINAVKKALETEPGEN